MNIIFITGKVLPNSAQGVRYRNLLSQWHQDHDITILSLYDYINDPKINIRKVIISAKINPKGFGTKNVSNKKKIDIKIRLKNIYKKYIDPLIFPDRYIFFIPKFKKNIKRIINLYKIDVVIIAFTPYSLYPLAKFIRKLESEIKIILDFSDPFLMNEGLKILSIYKKFFIKLYEKYYLKYCDEIIVLNPKIKELYAFNYKSALKETNIHVIEQGVANNFISVKNQIKRNYLLRLVYIGSFYFKLREPFELYEAIKKYKNAITLDLYGNIDPKLLPDLGNPRFRYHGPIIHEELLDVIQKYDLIVFLDNFFGYQVPGKTIELIALRKPVLFIYYNDDSPTLDYIKCYNGFIMVKNNKQNILKALEDFDKGKINLSFEYEINKFTWGNLAKKYEKIFKK